MRKKVEVTKVAELTGHKDSIYCLTNGRTANEFFSVAGDGFVIQWDLNDTTKGRMLARVTNSIYCCHFDSSAKLLYVMQNFEGLHIIDIESRKEIKTIKLSAVSFFSITSDDNHIYVGSEIGEIYKISKTDYSFQRFIVSSKSVRSIEIEIDSLICGLSDHSIKIFDTESLALSKNIDAHDKSVFCVKKHKNSLISVARDAHIKIFDAESYELINDIPAHIYPINTIEVHPEGHFFATGSMDKTVKLWDINSHKLLKVIDNARNGGHTSSVNCLLWTSHKNQLISCSDDRKIIIWSFNTPE